MADAQTQNLGLQCAGAAISQWLGLRLQMLASTVTGLVALAAVLQKQGLLPGTHNPTGKLALAIPAA